MGSSLGLQVQDVIQFRGRNIVVVLINREKHLLWSGISSGRILLSPDGTMSNPKVYLIVTNEYVRERLGKGS